MREVVGMETVDKRIVLYYLCVLGNLNNLSMQQLKLKFIYAIYLNYLCFINYLLAQLNATYNISMQYWSGLFTLIITKLGHPFTRVTNVQFFLDFHAKGVGRLIFL